MGILNQSRNWAVESTWSSYLPLGKTVISWRGFVTGMLTGRDKVARLAQPYAAATVLCR
jgi:hypothetical protein